MAQALLAVLMQRQSEMEYTQTKLLQAMRNSRVLMFDVLRQGLLVSLDQRWEAFNKVCYSAAELFIAWTSTLLHIGQYFAPGTPWPPV